MNMINKYMKDWKEAAKMMAFWLPRTIVVGFKRIIIFVLLFMMAFSCSAIEDNASGKTKAEIALEHQLVGTQVDLSRTLDDTKDIYFVTGEYFVPAGSELIIKKGVVLIFGKNAGLSIQGNLMMEGSADNPIVCKARTTGIGVWMGLKVCTGSHADIEGVSITGAKCAIEILTPASVRKAWICKNEAGVDCHNANSVLEDCYICDNREYGVKVTGTLKAIDHCTISGNRGNGITGWGGCRMVASVISRNGNCGIDCWNGGCEVLANKCYISENKKYDVKNGSNATWDCTENFWGIAVTKMLEQKGVAVNLPKIFDRKDNQRTGVVDISKWLKVMPEDCGAREYPGNQKKSVRR